MSSLILTIRTPKGAGNLSQLRFKRHAMEVLRDLTIGLLQGSIECQSSSVDPIRATGNVTLASTAADATVTIAGTVLTAKASPDPQIEGQWSQSGSDAADAIALAACINKHSVLKYFVYAIAVTTTSPAASKVFLYANAAGPLGNLVALSVSGTGLTASGSFLTGGAGGGATIAKTLEA